MLDWREFLVSCPIAKYDSNELLVDTHERSFKMFNILLVL